MKALLVACKGHGFFERGKVLFLPEVENKLFPARNPLESANEEGRKLVASEVVALMLASIGYNLLIS